MKGDKTMNKKIKIENDEKLAYEVQKIIDMYNDRLITAREAMRRIDMFINSLSHA